MARKATGKPRLETISVKVSPEIKRELYAISETERRTVSQIASFMIERAIAARGKRKKEIAS